MKKILSILGAIGLTATSTTSLIACNKPDNSENGGNNIPITEQPPKDSNWKLIDNLWKEDATINKDKYYFWICWDYKENRWKTNSFQMGKVIIPNSIQGLKAVYRWNGTGEPKIPEIDKNTGKISKWNEKTD